MKPIDLVELRSQIKSGMLRPFVNRGRVYLEDTESGEYIPCGFGEDNAVNYKECEDFAKAGEQE